jgi:hypothetical protein
MDALLAACDLIEAKESVAALGANAGDCERWAEREAAAA